MPTGRKSESDTKTESSDEPQVKVKSEKRGRIIKYMGSSDIRRLEVGESLLHQAPPLENRIEWHSRGNAHLIHTADHPEVPKEFWDQLLKLTDFQDVTEEFHDPDKEVPPGLWDKIWNTATHPSIIGR